MRKIIAAFFLIYLSVAVQAEPKGTLDVEVSGVTTDSGLVRVMLFNQKDNWLNEERAFATVNVRAKKGTMKVQFKNVPLKARYAISVQHDLNGNGVMDTGRFIPMPTEPVGASYHEGTSMPRYYGSSFRFNQEPLTVPVTLRIP